MKTPLKDWFGKNIQAIEGFQILMQECKIESRILMVVCLGAGDAFQKRYWPTLSQLVLQKKIKLAVVDSKPLSEKFRKIFDQHSPDWLRFIQCNLPQDGPLNTPDEEWYGFLTADIVFVLMPDHMHVKVAAEWLKHAKAIFVEKPYDRYLQEAEAFEDNIKAIYNMGKLPSTIVIPFDHYFGKIGNLILNNRMEEIVSDRCGHITNIKFSLTEPWPIEGQRAKSLEYGMIFDLFCHILAILHPFVNLDAIDFKVYPARHHGSLIGNSETYAFFTSKSTDSMNLLNSINIKGVVGKGVGKSEEKWLELIGTTGILRINFHKSDSGMFINKSGTYLKLDDLEDGHSNVLKTIFKGEYVENPVGGLTGDIALIILRKLFDCKNQVNNPNLVGYPLFLSSNDILNAKQRVIWKQPKAILFDADVLGSAALPADMLKCRSQDCWMWSIVKMGIAGTIPSEFLDILEYEAPDYWSLASLLDVPESNCVVVTQDLDNAKGAKSANMRVILIANSRNLQIPSTADLTISRFEDFSNWLRNNFLKDYWVKPNIVSGP